jgi:hypothetical protein
MALANYDREHIAVHAAGWMNGAGTSSMAWGCSLTRFTAGHFGLLLDASQGVVDNETFTVVQIRNATLVRFPVVEDVSATQKNVRVFDSSGAVAAADIEVILNKIVLPG